MKFQLGAMTVGEILDRGLKLLFSRLGAFFLINLLILTPLLLLQVGVAAVAGKPEYAGLVLLLMVLLLLSLIILQPLATAAILKIIQGEYLGERISMGSALGTALRCFGPLLGASILTGLLVFVFLLLLIIPGIMAAVSYQFVGQVVVMEGLSGMAALDRSANLAKGYRWRIFGILLLIGIVNGVLGAVLGQALEMVLPATQTTRTQFGPVVQITNATNYMIHQAVVGVVNILLAAYGAVCTTLIYFDLRVRKEGYDLEVAARGQGQVAEQV